MYSEARRTLLPLAALVVLLAGCSERASPEAPATSPYTVGKGIQQNASLASLQGGGWTVCYSGTYTDGASIATILSGCTGTYMMLACRSGTSDTLALGAADLRSVVTKFDETSQFHASSGVGWYFNDMLSWGFFPASETVNLDPCDYDTGTQTMKDKRMCWHAAEGSLSPGYRCGDNALNTDATWQRLILVHP